MPHLKNQSSDVEHINLHMKSPEHHQGNLVNISISFDSDKCSSSHTEKRIEPLHAATVTAKPPSPRVEIVRDYDKTEPRVYHAEYVRPVMVGKQAAYPETRVREVPRRSEHSRSKVLHGYLVAPRELPKVQAPVVHSEPPRTPVRSQQSRYLLLKVDECGSEYEHDNRSIHSSVYQGSKHNPRMEVVPSTRNHFFP